MTLHALPIVFTLLVWWFATGLVLLAVNRPPATYRRSLIVATVILVVSLIGLNWASREATVAGAYVAFFCGVLIWGWLEITYYTGWLTGPRPLPCPTGVSTWRRFSLALKASLYHELAIIAFAGSTIVLTWGAPNQVGTWTFITLWLMRWSAKLNIFLGVPRLNLQWFPDHLRYLESFIVRRPMNALFPLSMLLSLAVAVFVLSELSRGDATSTEIVSALLVGSLILLAVLEHGFLVLPLPDSALWNWALPAARRRPQDSTGRVPPPLIDTPPAGRCRRVCEPLAGLKTASVFASSPSRPAPTTNGR